MRSERWSNEKEIAKILKEGAAGQILSCENGKVSAYDGEGHGMYLGVSGAGKSRRGTIPTTMSFIKNKESSIITDPKGEIYAHTKDMISKEYDVHVLDFRHLYSSNAEGWNPLYTPYRLWKSGNPENMALAEQMIDELAHVMYPMAGNDPFWPKQAREVFIGAVNALFEHGKEDQINLASVYYIISRGDERFGSSTYLKAFVDLSQDKESVAMQLYSYVTTANDTRGGIRSVFLDGLSMATKSESIRKFLSHDELRICELRGDKPTLIYIIVPDETPVYDALTGVLVSQLMKHYVRIAEQKYKGKLPVRMNVLLEELGNIGRAIADLPHLMTAGRSRNIRVIFVLQSISQLTDIYGNAKAVTIMDNCDVRVAFRVNHWDTLTELSRACGEREVYCDGYIKKEPLITQSQLSSMETGQALVLIKGKTKFVTWLPDFTEMSISQYVPDVKKARRRVGRKGSDQVSCFDIREYVKAETQKKENERREKLMKQMKESFDKEDDIPFDLPAAWARPSRKPPAKDERGRPDPMHIDMDALIVKIDEKIAELEAQETEDARKEKEKKEIAAKREKDAKCNLKILRVSNEARVRKYLKMRCGFGKRKLDEVMEEIRKGGYVMKDLEKLSAQSMSRVLRELGAVTEIIDKNDA